MSKRIIRELISILMAIIFPVLGILIVSSSQKFIPSGANNDLVTIFLLLLPIITYTIFSGRLGEFKAAGIEAKFLAFAEESVELKSENISLDDKMQALPAKDIAQMKESLSKDQVSLTKPLVLTLMFGYQYDPNKCLNYVRALSQYINFRFVVFLNKEGAVNSYTPARYMLELLNDEVFTKILLEAIKTSDEDRLHKCPGVIRKTIATRTTNLNALKEMVSQNLDALVVVHTGKCKGMLAGVVEREQIISKLLLELAE